MRYLLVIIVLILLVALLVRDDEAPSQGYVVAARVIDGDTFVTRDGETVRLAGIDAPERGELGYGEAKNLLRAIISGQQLRFEQVKQDKYGRTVACVYTRFGTGSVDNYLLAQGITPWKGVRC